MDNMQRLAALQGDGYYSINREAIADNGASVSYYETWIDGNATVPVTDDDEAIASFYRGTARGAAVSFEGYSQDVTIDLNYSSDTSIYDVVTAGGMLFQSVTSARGSDGNSVIIGSDVAETLYAGMGDSTLTGGAGRDLLVSDNANKFGSASFYFNAGDGKDTIDGFEAYEVGSESADQLVISTNSDTEYRIIGNNVRIALDANDQVTLLDMADKKLIINNEVTAIGNSLNYEVDVQHYVGNDSSATLSVGDLDTDVSIWMNLGDFGVRDYGVFEDIKVIDARGYYEDAVLVGGYQQDNVIYGGHGTNLLWGGNGGNDTLYGGSGDNTYFYLDGDGNDEINGAKSNEILDLTSISFDKYDIQSLVEGVSADAIEIKFNDGGSVKVNGSADVVLKLQGGYKWSADRSTGGWTYRGQDE